ncbi:MAG: ATP-binding protein [Saprospiraceae bacterium]|nr:ATP-binding protein [Saprospiraceae bacterium]
MPTINPFDKDKFVGYVSKVTPEITKVHFPNSKLLKKFYYDGDVLHSGIVRSYVVIEGEGYGFLAKIISIELPEKERMFLSESSFQNTNLHPVGSVEIQLCFDLFEDLQARKGLDNFPPVGAKVYSCPVSFIHSFIKNFGTDSLSEVDDLLEMGFLPELESEKVNVSANALFSRHCAIVGTTGSGKSYSMAKLIEELIKKDNAKVILLDATGEYQNLGLTSENVEIAPTKDCFHYKNLLVQDLYSIYRPAGQVQVPKLIEAIRSLKIVDLANTLNLTKLDTDGPNINHGLLHKAGTKRSPFLNFYYTNSDKLNENNINFDITRLPMQIVQECAWENDLDWGNIYENHRSNCSSLILRIQQRMEDDSFGAIFNFKNAARNDLGSIINKFVATENSNKLLRINLSDVPKETDLIEILTNAIGRKLFNLAKEGNFKTRPVICFLDEAHIFLNKKIKDEYSLEVELDAFDRIAKECRKYGLFLCLSTQRPRDIPQGVLSQMGTFIAHRLINQFDRQAVEAASPEGSKNLLAFLPSLGKGDAILMGVDFPMPINLKIGKVEDKNKPNSHTPLMFVRKPIPIDEEE